MLHMARRCSMRSSTQRVSELPARAAGAQSGLRDGVPGGVSTGRILKPALSHCRVPPVVKLSGDFIQGTRLPLFRSQLVMVRAMQWLHPANGGCKAGMVFSLKSQCQ